MFTAQLLPVEGGDPIELTRDITVVGRKDDADLRIDHKSVSKQHCVLVKTDGLLLVRDLGSTNGTRVNGQRVRRAAITPDDVVAFAGVKYRVKLSRRPAVEAAQEATQPAPADSSADLPPASEDKAHAGPIAVVHTHELPDVYPDEPSES